MSIDKGSKEKLVISAINVSVSLMDQFFSIQDVDFMAISCFCSHSHHCNLCFFNSLFHPFIQPTFYGPTRISGTIQCAENTYMSQIVEISALPLWGLYSSGRRQIINKIYSNFIVCSKVIYKPFVERQSREAEQEGWAQAFLNRTITVIL